MIDRTARAAQLGRIVDHAGERFTFPGVAADFGATVAPWTPQPTEADRDLREAGNAVLLAIARIVFGGKLPRKGQCFADTSGRSYRILGPRPLPPTSALVEYVCAAPVA